MAHKKGLGSSRNGRDSNPKMLGVKIFAASGSAAARSSSASAVPASVPATAPASVATTRSSPPAPERWSSRPPQGPRRLGRLRGLLAAADERTPGHRPGASRPRCAVRLASDGGRLEHRPGARRGTSPRGRGSVRGARRRADAGADADGARLRAQPRGRRGGRPGHLARGDQGIDRFEGRSSLRTWIFQILLNTARTRGEREKRALPFSSLRRPARARARDEPAVDADRFQGGDGQRPGWWSRPPAEWEGADARLESDEAATCCCRRSPICRRASAT